MDAVSGGHEVARRQVLEWGHIFVVVVVVVVVVQVLPTLAMLVLRDVLLLPLWLGLRVSWKRGQELSAGGRRRCLQWPRF